MAAAYPLEIVTPDGVAFSGGVTSLVAPAYDGYLGVLAKHAPMVCVLRPGVLRVEAEGARRLWRIEEGFLEVTRTKTLVLVPRLIPAESQG
jgi:F-type H+-transporting ATPase subunit epsilon